MSTTVTAPESAPTSTGRRLDLDALRIVLVLGLVVFHSALVFDTNDDFYVKNDVTIEVTGVLGGPIIVWAMPAMFLIAGIAARQSLRRRSAAVFLRERLLRLGVPLLVITVLVTPFPQWLRALATEPRLGYLDFLPRFFEVRFDVAQAPFFLTGEWFEFGHLWFVVLLLAWCLLLAAFVAALPHRLLSRWSSRVEVVAARFPLVLLLPSVGFAAVGALLPLEEGYAAWNRWSYLLFFAIGVILGSDALRAPIRRAVPSLIVAAVLCFGCGIAVFLVGGGQDLFTESTVSGAAFRACYAVTGWCTTMAIVGGLDRLESRRPGPPLGRAQGYLGAVSMPFYIVHQPVVVGIAFVVVATDLPAVAKFAVVVVLGFAASFVLVEVLRRTPGIRRVVGVGPVPGTAPPST